jgi:hypothetical protein
MTALSKNFHTNEVLFYCSLKLKFSHSLSFEYHEE